MPRTAESDESRILNFFRNAPLEVARVVFNLVRSEMKERDTAPAVKRGRKPKAQSAPEAVASVGE